MGMVTEDLIFVVLLFIFGEDWTFSLVFPTLVVSVLACFDGGGPPVATLVAGPAVATLIAPQLDNATLVVFLVLLATLSWPEPIRLILSTRSWIIEEFSWAVSYAETARSSSYS